MKNLGMRRLPLGIMLALAGCGVTQLALAQSSQSTQTQQDGSPPPASQDSSPPSASKAKQLQAVEVTASRITGRPDLSLPTPVVPVSASELNLSVATNVGTALNDLPQFVPAINGYTNSNQSANSGQTSLNLRGLGTSRTLVLLDSRRFVGSNDLNTIPSIMIKGVQVVTGGASATWGSGAVAGVANILLDTNFVGFDSKIQEGVSQYGDSQQHRIELKFGSEYAGGKGHFVIGGEFAHQAGIGDAQTARGGIAAGGLLPIGGGKFQVFPNVASTNQTLGGIITTGALAGNVFNPDGTLRPFVPGSFTVGKSTVGSPDAFTWTYGSPLVPPIKHYSILANTSYDINDNIQLFAQARFSKAYEHYAFLSNYNGGNIPISIDNAFLLPAIRQQMQAAGQTSFKLGRGNTDLNPMALYHSRKNTEFTVGAKGRIGESFWHWSGSFTHGTLVYNKAIGGLQLTKQFGQAVDSVISPATQQPICRVALVDPSTDCVPIDLFGYGAPSVAAAQYVTGAALLHRTDTLDDAEFSVNGSLFDLPAGTVSLAAGADWRRESVNGQVGPDDLNHRLTLLHFSPLQGAYTVQEGFGEVFVPLLQDLPFARDLSADVAARISDYSGSGTVWSYKGGLNDDIGGGVRLRADWSRDIRAANADERFTEGGSLFATVIDPTTGQQAQNVAGITGGNGHLLPEKADTGTVGVSWAPSFLSGFKGSVDYYHINISNVITTLGQQDILNRCAGGSQDLCALVTRDANNTIVSINTSFLNLAQYKTDGVDFDLQYTQPGTLFGQSGEVSSRLMTTWVHKLSVFDGVNTVKYVEDAGSGIGGPRWRANWRVGFDSKDFSVFGRARFLSQTKVDRTLDIVNNDIGSYIYLDAGTQFNLTSDGSIRLSFSISNLMNKKPSILTGVNGYYDVLGRYYLAGLELRL